MQLVADKPDDSNMERGPVEGFPREDKDVMDRLRDCMDLLDSILFHYERGLTSKMRTNIKRTLEKSHRAFDRKANQVRNMR